MKKYDILKKLVLKGDTLFLESETQIDNAINDIIAKEKEKKTDGYYEARFKTLLALVVGATDATMNAPYTTYASLTLHLQLPIPKEYTPLENYWIDVVEKYRSQNL